MGNSCKKCEDFIIEKQYNELQVKLLKEIIVSKEKQIHKLKLENNKIKSFIKDEILKKIIN